jgi:hypothetical protein
MVLQKLSSKPFRSDEPLEGHPLPPFQAHFLKPINGLEDAAVNSEGEPTWYHHVTYMRIGLRPLSCHHQTLTCPKSRLTHQPGSQQMPHESLEAAGHL